MCVCLKKIPSVEEGVSAVPQSTKKVDVFTVGGTRLRTMQPAESATQGLTEGIYVVDGVKVLIQP